MQRVFTASVYSNAAHSDIVVSLRAPLDTGSDNFPLGWNVSKNMAAPARFAAWEPLFGAARTIKLSTCQHAVLMSAGRSHLRQIIAHNIRYKDLSINNTLKNLDRYTRDDEYETLYLFLFGCDFEQGDTKQELRTQIDIEEKFQKRLESEQTKSAYEAALTLIQSDIDELERRKASLNLNPNFESDLDKLNKIKYEINLTSSDIGRLELRKELISEAQSEIQSSKSNIDLQQLQQIYQQATSLVSGIQKNFVTTQVQI